MSSVDINMNDLVTRNDKGFLANKIGEELVIMDLKSGNYIGLNPVGAYIWDILQTPASASDIIGRLLAAYDIDEATCREQTMEYLEKMQQQGLIQVGH